MKKTTKYYRIYQFNASISIRMSLIWFYYRVCAVLFSISIYSSTFLQSSSENIDFPIEIDVIAYFSMVNFQTFEYVYMKVIVFMYYDDETIKVWHQTNQTKRYTHFRSEWIDYNTEKRQFLVVLDY